MGLWLVHLLLVAGNDSVPTSMQRVGGLRSISIVV